MSRILLAWELGTGFGHLAPFLALAPKLLERGHELHVAAREIVAASKAVGGMPINLHQAPLCLNTYGGLQEPPLNYAEILMRYGYLEPDMLKAMLATWQSLLRATGADIVIADHAPTALLAARLLDLPRAVIGGAFNVPRAEDPTPNMRPWVSVPPQRLADSDGRVLAVINGALSAGQKIDALHRIFDGAMRMLSGVPELDPYGARDPVDYLGLQLLSTGRALPVWPQGEGPRVFVYLHSNYSHVERALQALAACRARVLVYMFGGDTALAQKYAGSSLQFSTQTLDLRKIIEECDLCACHGNTGTTLSMLSGGRPLLVLPIHLEHFLLGKAVERAGAGRVVHPDVAEPDIAGALNAMLRNAAYAEHARTLARRYATESVGTMAARAVARIEALAAQAAGSQQ